MPLTPALQARLKKRGIVSKGRIKLVHIGDIRVIII
jgi:hypothetical protein